LADVRSPATSKSPRINASQLQLIIFDRFPCGSDMDMMIDVDSFDRYGFFFDELMIALKNGDVYTNENTFMLF
jgi:hypothetical protein